MSENNELILGKYKDLTELESAYKSLKNNYDELAQNKNKFTIPDEYSLNDEFKLIDTDVVNKTIEEARSARFTQSQFELKLKDNSEKNISKNKKREDFKSKYSDDIEHLQSYIKEDIGLDPDILYNLSDDEIKNIKNNRENSLKTNTNIGSGEIPSFKVTREDAHNAFVELQKAKAQGDSKGIQYHLNRYKEMIGSLND